MDQARLTRDDWLKAARLALLRGGPDALRVERLARDLKVTKGSFYWHYRDLSELKEALIADWEGERSFLTEALETPGGARRLILNLTERAVASERGEVPSDAGIFRWAAVDPAIRERVNRGEAERVALIRRLGRTPEEGELFYMAYLGFILRRRHEPGAEAHFAILVRYGLQAMAGPGKTPPP